ncbi:hypothetical protein [Saccharopolyspora taberi]|uniref:Uncharacterized protein n=1 Tax=Saccharopolyspora taberi TaxID=60895 RepID=A0ABN3VLP1_9PSEU
MAGSVQGSPPGGAALELLDPARQMRWRVPELALVLSDRAVAQARRTGDRAVRLRAEALALFATNRLGRGVSATGRAIGAVRDAESTGESDLAAELRVELAYCARSAGSHEVAVRVLRPVLDREQLEPLVRAHALLALAAALPAHRTDSERADALDEAERLYAAATELSRDTNRILRARVSTARAGHHRRQGQFLEAVATADGGLELLERLGDPAADSGEIHARLVLERVQSLLELGRSAEAVEAAADVLGRPVRAAAAGPSGWLRLALATRVYQPEGAHRLAVQVLNDGVAIAERHKLDGLLAETLGALSNIHERAEELTEALTALRRAYAADRRWRAAVHSARLRLLEEFPALVGADLPAPAYQQLPVQRRQPAPGPSTSTPHSRSQPGSAAQTPPASSGQFPEFGAARYQQLAEAGDAGRRPRRRRRKEPEAEPQEWPQASAAPSPASAAPSPASAAPSPAVESFSPAVESRAGAAESAPAPGSRAERRAAVERSVASEPRVASEARVANEARIAGESRVAGEHLADESRVAGESRMAGEHGVADQRRAAGEHRATRERSEPAERSSAGERPVAGEWSAAGVRSEAGVRSAAQTPTAGRPGGGLAAARLAAEQLSAVLMGGEPKAAPSAGPMPSAEPRTSAEQRPSAEPAPPSGPAPSARPASSARPAPSAASAEPAEPAPSRHRSGDTDWAGDSDWSGDSHVSDDSHRSGDSDIRDAARRLMATLTSRNTEQHEREAERFAKAQREAESSVRDDSAASYPAPAHPVSSYPASSYPASSHSAEQETELPDFPAYDQTSSAASSFSFPDEPTEPEVAAWPGWDRAPQEPSSLREPGSRGPSSAQESFGLREPLGSRESSGPQEPSSLHEPLGSQASLGSWEPSSPLEPSSSQDPARLQDPLGLRAPSEPEAPDVTAIMPVIAVPAESEPALPEPARESSLPPRESGERTGLAAHAAGWPSFDEQGSGPADAAEPEARHEGGRRSRGKSLAEIRAALQLLEDARPSGRSGGRRRARHAEPDDVDDEAHFEFDSAPPFDSAASFGSPSSFDSPASPDLPAGSAGTAGSSNAGSSERWPFDFGLGRSSSTADTATSGSGPSTADSGFASLGDSDPASAPPMSASAAAPGSEPPADPEPQAEATHPEFAPPEPPPAPVADLPALREVGERAARDEPVGEIGLADLLAEALVAYENGRRSEAESRRSGASPAGHAESGVAGITGAHAAPATPRSSTSDSELTAPPARHRRAAIDSATGDPQSWTPQGY